MSNGKTTETQTPPPKEDTRSHEEKLKDTELKNLLALTRKAEAEAVGAEYQNKEQTRQRNFYERILSTTQGAVILALLTLISQIFQFGFTAGANRQAARDKAWRDSVGALSFEGDAKSVGAALNLETFFDSSLHREDAKSLVASVLPNIKNDEAFDNIFFSLLRATSKRDETFDIYDVEHDVSTSYRNAVEDSSESPNESTPSISQRIGAVLLSRKLLDSGKSEADLDVIKARHLEYLIDSVSHGLSDFWRKHIIPAGSPSDYAPGLNQIILFYDDNGTVNLRGVVLTRAQLQDSYLRHVDLTGADLRLSNLADSELAQAELRGAHLDGSIVNGVNFEDTTGQNSTWAEVKWWEAKRISPSLCTWLKQSDSKAPALPPRALNPCH